MRKPRFEIVRTAVGWHARFRAANGRIIFSTEVYETHRAARRAIAVLARPFDAYLTHVGVRPLTDVIPQTEVREVDER